MNRIGYNIPQKELAQDYVWAVLWAGFLGLTILAWPVPRSDKRGLLCRASRRYTA